MAVNDLAISFTDLEKLVAIEMGWDRTSSNWSTDQDNVFALIVKDGLRQFYYPPPLPNENRIHDWSFLYPSAQLELTPAYATGTIEVTLNVTVHNVTLTSGTWPDWAAQGEIEYTSTDGTKILAPVTARSSDTVLVVGDTDTKYLAAASTSYTLRRLYYDLPDDFGGMASDGFNYRRDSDLHLPEIKSVGEADLRSIDRQTAAQLYPRYYNVDYIAPTSSQSSRARVRFFPLAQQTYYLDYRYRAIPPTIDGAGTNPYPYGGAEHAATIEASIIDKAYQRLRDSFEYHSVFMERLHASVLHDRRQNRPHTLGFGPMSDGRGSSVTLTDARRKTPYSNISTSF